MLISPEDHRISSALRFAFKASNNEVEYEALLAGLRLAKELQVDSLMIYSDSKLVVSQVLDKFQARDDRMAAYLEKVKAELRNFSRHEVKNIDREDNANADPLAKLATSRDAELLRLVPIEIVTEPSITKQHSVEAINAQPSWMDPRTRMVRGQDSCWSASKIIGSAARCSSPSGPRTTKRSTKPCLPALDSPKNFKYIRL